LGYEDTSSASSGTAVSTPVQPGIQADGGDGTVIQLSDMEDGISSTLPKSSKRNGLRRRSSVKRQRSEIGANAGKKEVPVAVVEQRVSNLAQGCLCGSSSS